MDYRFAMLASVFVNMWRGKDSSPAKLTDFILQFDREPEDQSDMDMRRMAMRITRTLGGPVK